MRSVKNTFVWLCVIKFVITTCVCICIKRKKNQLIDGITGRPTLTHAGFQSREAEIKRGYARIRVKARLIIKICIRFHRISRDYYKSLSTFAPMQIFPREKLMGSRVFPDYLNYCNNSNKIFTHQTCECEWTVHRTRRDRTKRHRI